jgi:hypothetical protein
MAFEIRAPLRHTPARSSQPDREAPQPRVGVIEGEQRIGIVPA